MKSKFNAALTAAVLSLGLSGLVLAATEAQPGAQSPAATAPMATNIKPTSGEVRKIDTDQGKLTIKHGPIDNLQMPAMTMVFKASKPEMLQNIKVGDKIEFRAESVAGAFLVTDIKPAN